MEVASQPPYDPAADLDAMLQVLTCRKCGGGLQRSDGGSTCVSCKTHYDFRDGVFVAEENEYYWGEVSQQEMQEANARAADEGVAAAVDRLSRNFPSVTDYALGLDRADWRFNLPEHEKGRVLDIGSGWGTIPFLLCDDYAEVWSCEYVSERIRWQSIRRDEERRPNLRLVQANLNSLPFKDESFDLVSLNGVLEWMGLASDEGSPRDIQRAVLKSCHAKLRPGGFIYIGIENRIGWNMFLGQRDHSGLPFTSLMPRWLASATLRLVKRSEYRTSRSFARYRTYTYSPPGYRRLLREAGFEKTVFYWVFPGYNRPITSGRLEDSRAFIEYLRFRRYASLKGRALGLALRLLCGAGLQRFFVPTVLIYASK